MTTFNVEPRKKAPSMALCFFIAVLIMLLLVGAGIEVAYYLEVTDAMTGLEQERDYLLHANETLRIEAIDRLRTNTGILEEVRDNLQCAKNNSVLH